MTKVQLRHDTAANWTAANPVLAAGEAGVETDTLKVKVGNGSTAWTSLAYVAGSATGLATVATTGAYADLTGKPTLGTAAAQATSAFDAAGAAAAAQAAAIQRANHTGTQSADTIVDGATNKAYTATEKTKLAGLGAGGAGLPSTIVTKTSAYTAAAGDFVEADTSTAGFTVTLPTAPAAGALVAVKKISNDANTITITPAGGGTIDGDANATTVTQWAGAVFEHKASNVWRIAASMTTTGPAGPSGVAGANGALWYSGTGAPSSAVGVTGDYYLRDTGLVYSKATGTWASTGISLAGPTGATGPQGAAGSNGTNGAIAQVQDEGSNLTVRPTLNFVGLNVTATDDAANSRTNITIAGGGGGGAFTAVGSVISGRYTGLGNGTSTTNTASVGRLYYIPFQPGVSFTITEMGVEVTTGTASATARIGLYSTLNGLPNALLVEATAGGALDCSTVGYKASAAMSQTVTAGTLYWLGIVPQGANITTRAGDSSLWSHYIPTTSATSFGFGNYQFYQGGVTGTLPATATVAGSLGEFTPKILMKAA